MNLMTESLLFIQALLAHTDRLKALLSEAWPEFKAKLDQNLADLNKTETDEQVLFLVDEILEAGLTSPAAELVRSLFKQSSDQAGSVDSTTRSVWMTDPTLGQEREVVLQQAGEDIIVETVSPVNRADIVAAGQALYYAMEALDATVPPTPVTERRISVWISERATGAPEPLGVGVSYILNFKVGQPVPANLIVGPESVIPPADVPETGLLTDWVVMSRTVELASLTSDITVTSETVGQTQMWIAQFSLHIPKEGDSAVPQLQITPRVAANANLEVIISVRQELYRQFIVQFAVAEPLALTSTVTDAATIHNDLLHTPILHANLRTTHEWTTPPGETSISIFEQVALVNGDDRSRLLNSRVTPWSGVSARVAGPIKNVRATAERFRARWENYLNAIDPDDLAQQLTQWTPEDDWTSLRNLADPAHQNAWDEVVTSAELRDLAYDGHVLYESFFPAGSLLRIWLDSLTPGHRLNLSWLPTSGAGWIAQIPWGLMYLPDISISGDPVDPLGFLALRFRLSYSAHEVQAGSKALGPPDAAYRGHLLYWGNQPQDLIGVEAQWQRQQWAKWQNQVFVPASLTGPDLKQELLRLLDNPGPAPMTILYLFCQCAVGDGNDPVLRFGSTNQMNDVIKRTELGTRTLIDQPFVFANACTTSAADPYFANELEENFFRRGCRAYLGTEARVPIQFASRFASIFFHFFLRQIDPQPMAAGEAVTQTRLFLWTRYRNIGGIFYTYINQYELFMASDADVAALRL